ncbi:MAG: hypothetical protein ACKOVB_12710 [Terrabacter sp.]
MDSSGNAASPAPSAGLDPDEARRLLERTEGVRRAARADAQGLAIPLLVLGPLTVIAAALQRFWLWWMVHDLAPGESRSATDGELTFSHAVDTYWGTAGALGLLVIGIWFAVRSRRVGAGSGSGAWIAGAVAAFVLIGYIGAIGWVPFLAPLGIVAMLAPTVFISLALLLISWRRHNGRLALWAVLFGVVTVLASLGFFDNRFYDLLGLLGLSDEVVLAVGGWGDLVAQVALGVAMVVVGRRSRRGDEAVR